MLNLHFKLVNQYSWFSNNNADGKKILGFELATFQSTHRTSITTGLIKTAKLATLSATISTLDWEKTKTAAQHLKSYKEWRRIVFEQLATPQTSSDGYKTQEKKFAERWIPLAKNL